VRLSKERRDPLEARARHLEARARDLDAREREVEARERKLTRLAWEKKLGVYSSRGISLPG